jgi:CheY-like chemotaxis protein
MGASSNPPRRPGRPQVQGKLDEPGHPEKIVWLGCAGHTTPALLGHCATSLDQQETLGSLVVVLEHLERLEDSITRLLLGLHSLAREFKTELTVIDPSGFSTTMDWILESDGPVSLCSSAPLERNTRRILFVGQPDGGMDFLRKVLELFGCHTQVVQTAGEARRAVIQSPPDAILLDLDLPCAQALGVADYVRDHGLDTALLGVTSLEDVWNHDVSVRYGFHRIFGRPFLVRDVLEALGIGVSRS